MNSSTYHNQTDKSLIDHLVNDTTSASWTNLNVTKAQIVFTAAYVVLFLVAVLGNAFVIHVARKLLPTRGPFNLLVINMAACDILYAFIVVPNLVYYQYAGIVWFPGGFGTFLYKFSFFAAKFAIESSIFILTAMTVERYLAIVPRIKRKLTRRNAFKIIAAVFGFSTLHSTTELFKLNTGYRDYQNTTITVCYMMWSKERDTSDTLFKVEMVITFVVGYALPVITMVTLDYFVIRFLWLREIPGNRTEQNELQKRKQLRKVILMLVTMATTFVITWFPFHVAHYYWAFDADSSLSNFMFTLLVWFAHTNCATNPCFYLVFNTKYRDELQHVGQWLKSCFRC